MRSLNFFVKILEHPILAIGILMMGTLLYNLHTRGILGERAEKLKPYPCRAAILTLVRVAPKDWEIKCLENNLQVKIPFTPPTTINMTDNRVAKVIHTREIANQLSYISKNTGNEQLGRTNHFAIMLESPRMAVEVTGTCKDLSLLVDINTPDEIMKHLVRFKFKEQFK